MIRNIAPKNDWRSKMLKIRLQGTTNELKWFRKILEKNSNFEILSISEPYANKGTNKYFRVYVDVERIRH